MRFEIKPGVRMVGLQPQCVLGMMIVKEVYFSRGLDCVITSVTEGVHSRASIHYTGGAFDVRTRHVPVDDMKDLSKDIKNAIGDDFDVVLHMEPENLHIHVEYQPKKPY